MFTQLSAVTVTFCSISSKVPQDALVFLHKYELVRMEIKIIVKNLSPEIRNFKGRRMFACRRPLRLQKENFMVLNMRTDVTRLTLKQ